MAHSIRALKFTAKQACKWRGHTMINFKKVKAMDGTIYYNSECSKCKMYVQVTDDPPPNGIDIGGNAVALNCKGN